MSERPTEPTDSAIRVPAEPTASVVAGQVVARRSTDASVLPTRAWADRDEAWGDRHEDASNDERLLREKPPHWS